MRHPLFRWIAALLVSATCLLPGAYAQRGGSSEISRGVRAGDEVGPGIDTSHSTAALPYAVAGFALMIVLVIVCMPSRKQIRE
jgi:hypothetical protein